MARLAVSQEQGWQALFGVAFRRSRNPMVLLDEERTQLDFNGAYLKLVGYASEALLGRAIYELSPDGPLLSAREWAANISRSEFTGERELTRADGTTITVLWAAHPETVTGQPTRSVSGADHQALGPEPSPRQRTPSSRTPSCRTESARSSGWWRSATAVPRSRTSSTSLTTRYGRMSATQ